MAARHRERPYRKSPANESYGWKYSRTPCMLDMPKDDCVQEILLSTLHVQPRPAIVVQLLVGVHET